MLKYTILTLAVVSLGASAYLAYARFMQKKRTDTIPLYVSIGLTVALFGLAWLDSKRETPKYLRGSPISPIEYTPNAGRWARPGDESNDVEYTPIDGSWGSDTMNEYLRSVSSRVGLTSPTNKTYYVTNPP